eukprot:7859003-Pyramimonas_sp.AAC.1
MPSSGLATYSPKKQRRCTCNTAREGRERCGRHAGSQRRRNPGFPGSDALCSAPRMVWRPGDEGSRVRNKGSVIIKPHLPPRAVASGTNFSRSTSESGGGRVSVGATLSHPPRPPPPPTRRKHKHPQRKLSCENEIR